MNNNQPGKIKLPAQEWLGYDPERGDIHGYTFEQMREFAKTIVEDCAKICRDMAWASSEPTKYMECEMAIEKHFGVEE